MKKPRKIATSFGLAFEVHKDDGDYERIIWEARDARFAYLRLSEAKKLRAMCDYVIEKSEEPSK